MRGFSEKLTLLVGRIVQSHSVGLGFGGCLSNSASYFVEKVKISVTPLSIQRTTDILLLVKISKLYRQVAKGEKQSNILGMFCGIQKVILWGCVRSNAPTYAPREQRLEPKKLYETFRRRSVAIRRQFN